MLAMTSPTAVRLSHSSAFPKIQKGMLARRKRNAGDLRIPTKGAAPSATIITHPHASTRSNSPSWELSATMPSTTSAQPR
jgi:hypothetical protein